MRDGFSQELDSPGFREARHRMVEGQLCPRGIRSKAVLEAMQSVPRHAFVPAELVSNAYADGPLPIGSGQTISQPYIVAVMSEALQLAPGQRVLEIGTGCGYQAAVLAEMGLDVYTVEFVALLADEARERLAGLGYSGIHFRTGDGRIGWSDEAPFDGIIVTAAPESVPEELLEQLSPGGRLVIPVGQWSQELRVYLKNHDGSCTYRTLFPVRFVPLVRP